MVLGDDDPSPPTSLSRHSAFFLSRRLIGRTEERGFIGRRASWWSSGVEVGRRGSRLVTRLICLPFFILSPNLPTSLDDLTTSPPSLPLPSSSAFRSIGSTRSTNGRPLPHLGYRPSFVGHRRAPGLPLHRYPATSPSRSHPLFPPFPLITPSYPRRPSSNDNIVSGLRIPPSPLSPAPVPPALPHSRPRSVFPHSPFVDSTSASSSHFRGTRISRLSTPSPFFPTPNTPTFLSSGRLLRRSQLVRSRRRARRGRRIEERRIDAEEEEEVSSASLVVVLPSFFSFPLYSSRSTPL